MSSSWGKRVQNSSNCRELRGWSGKGKFWQGPEEVRVWRAAYLPKDSKELKGPSEVGGKRRKTEVKGRRGLGGVSLGNF